MRALAAVLLIGTTGAAAQLPTDDSRIETAQPARVRPGASAHFYDGPAPDKQSRAYLVAGDPVVVWKRQAGFALVTFANGRGSERSGWLPDTALAAVPVAADRWAGAWKGSERTIAIARKGSRLIARGDATWGAGDPERVKNGGVNIGSFAAALSPVAGKAAFAMDDGRTGGIPVRDAQGDTVYTVRYDAPGEFLCRVRLRLLGDYLVAQDNGNCGGHNVTFSGTYRRVSGR